ncbi:MAG: DUF1405 domain-containing protein [Candidatus Aenigmatarchaeota archaeon]
MFSLKILSCYIFSNRNWLLLLAIINFIGFTYGIYYYYPQISVTPAYLLIFTLDSPLPVLLFGIICLVLYFKKQPPGTLVFLCIVGMIKYGLWTALVILLFWDYFFAMSPVIYSMNFPLHIGMIIEGIVLSYKLKSRTSSFVFVLLFFLANDILDYFFSTLPFIPSKYNTYLLYESLVVTLAVPTLLFWKFRKQK